MDELSYSAYLLETASPGRLLEVAAARAGRSLRGRIAGAPAPPSVAQILRWHGVETLDGLPAAFGAELSGPWAFSSPARLRLAAEELGRCLPGERERLLEAARRIHAGRVPVFGEEVEVRRRAGTTPFASLSWRPVDWEACPLGGVRPGAGRARVGADPKRQWALGRLEHVVILALGAVALGGEGSEATDLADAALDWALDLAQAPRGIQWTCPMEVALRGANVALALRALAATQALHRRPGALARLLQALEVHAASVQADLEDTVVVPNNHLVSNVVGMLVMGALAPGLRGCRALALAQVGRLPTLILEQTLDDGFTFEGSVGYHRLACELFVLGALAASSLGRPLGPAAAARLRAMLQASERLVDGRGETPQIGDADSGRALPFRTRSARDQRHLPSLGRALFGGAWGGAPQSAESIWSFGGVGEQEPAAQVGGPAGWGLDSALPRGGIWMLRSSRVSCSIACGPNGTGGTGTHGHNDKLSIEVCVDGVRVVADPGSGVYTSDPALRDRLRGTAQHSTGQVDGREQQPIPRRRLFALPESAHATCLQWEPSFTRSRFVGEHRGYLRLPEPVVHQREVVLDKGRHVVSLVDAFLGRGRHRVEVRYLVPLPRERVRLREARPLEGGALELGPAHPWVVEILHAGRPVARLGLGARPELEAGLYAPGYDQVEEATIVVVRREGELPALVRTCVSIATVVGEGKEGA